MVAQKQQKKKGKKSLSQQDKRRRFWYWVNGIAGGIILIILLTYVAFQVSPWPASLMIRHEFNKGGAHTSELLEKHVPQGINTLSNISYKEGDKDALLDIHYLEDKDRGSLPVVVWVHGGAWISGSKDTVANYAKIIASHGYAVIAVNYSIAPEKKYPTPVLQVSEALKFLKQNTKELQLNMNNIVFAGDSAGSQIAAQVATLITNEPYAKEVGIDAPIRKDVLKGLVLNCGAYDLKLASNTDNKDAKMFLDTVLWAYSGTRNYANDPTILKASVVEYVNSDFPPSFITAGNADPLEQQSIEFAQKLQSLGVATDTLFYAKDHEPALPHEYQFNLDTEDGKKSLERILAFLAAHTKE